MSVPRCLSGRKEPTTAVRRRVVAPVNPTLEQQVAGAFGAGQREDALRLLREYGQLPHEREADRVRWVIVKVSNGSLAELERLVRLAKEDYRDVLIGDPGYFRWRDGG